MIEIIDHLPKAHVPAGVHLYYTGLEAKLGPAFGPLEAALAVLPPSIHPSGRVYTWADWLDPWEAPIEELRPWMHEYLKKRNGSHEGASGSPNKQGWVAKLLQGVGKGQRDVMATKLAGYLYSKELPQDEVTELMLMWNERNRPPLNDAQINKILASASAWEMPDSGEYTWPENGLSPLSTL